MVITGAALGLPGTEQVFDDGNLGRLLRGEQFIDIHPERLRDAMLDKHITRLVKSDDGSARFETIDSAADVIKLAARGRRVRPATRSSASPPTASRRSTAPRSWRSAPGIDALRDAGIPLVLHYKTTTQRHPTARPLGAARGAARRHRRDLRVGVPGARRVRRRADALLRATGRAASSSAALEALREPGSPTPTAGGDARPRDRPAHPRTCDREIEEEPYQFDRRFLFRVLSMGHSQFAELIGARGPNTQVNSACASTTQAVALAEDWIRAGRCRRVIIVAADDVTSDNLLGWIGAGFLASGAAATDEVVEDAAVPFDRRRHGMILGMGAAAIVVESAEAARERGLQPICEVLGAVTANSAFHGTRLDVDHIGDVMERLVAQAERARHRRATRSRRETVFVSHETYTPARGGSAAAEIHALRHGVRRRRRPRS